MIKTITIGYWWKRSDSTKGAYKKVKDTHKKALEESAMNRAFDMIKEGYTEGELSDCIRMYDSDGEDGIKYNGWWNLTKK